MDLTVERDALLRLLARVHRIVERRNTTPILSNVLLAAGDGRLGLRATDLDLEASDGAAAEVAVPGATTVAAHVLHDIVRKLPEGTRVSLTESDGRLAVKAGRSRFALPTLPVDQFPDLEAGGLDTRFDLPAADFRGLFQRVQHAISTEETRYYLNGVYLHLGASASGEPAVKAVATDGHRLGIASAPVPAGAEGMPGVIVPRKAVAEALRLAADESDPIGIALSRTKIRLSIGGVTLTSKLVDGTFPDYARVVPPANDRSVRVARDALSAALDRVSVVSSERGKGVAMRIAAGLATLSMTNPDAGSATDEVVVAYEGDEFAIGFNVRYLLDILAVLAGDEVELLLAAEASAAIVRAPSDPSLSYVLMPMRV